MNSPDLIDEKWIIMDGIASVLSQFWRSGKRIVGDR